MKYVYNFPFFEKKKEARFDKDNINYWRLHLSNKLPVMYFHSSSLMVPALNYVYKIILILHSEG